MKKIKEYIESGILESYILGTTSIEESTEVEEMAAAYSEIREEMELISEALIKYAESNLIAPDPTIKPFLMATIDYSERMKGGELPSYPAPLHEGSKVVDYKEWLSRPDISLPPDFKDFHARIIGYTPQALTAIVWINKMAPQEVHDNEFEKFLIVEGTCSITIENEVHYLAEGDYLSIPLHKKHFVNVTSSIPCKVILQRIAA